MGVRLAVGRGPPRRTPALARTAGPTLDLRQRQAGATLPSAPQRLQHRLTSRRQPVARVQAFGEAELLQLPHVALERELLATHLGREFLGPDLGLLRDQLEHRTRPGAVAARVVHAHQPLRDLGYLGVAEVRLCAQLHARVRPGVAQLDPVDLTAAALVEHREQVVARLEARSESLVLAERRSLDYLDSSHLEHPDDGPQ